MTRVIRVEHDHGPAIDRMTPEERAIFVGMLAAAALKHALADLDDEPGNQPTARPRRGATPGTPRQSPLTTITQPLDERAG